MRVLGISGFYHDSAAVLVENEEIIAAAQEERFTRIKHDASFPHNAVEFCLQAAKIELSAVDYVVFYDKPFIKFERLFETYMDYAPRGFSSFRQAMPLWIKDKLFQKNNLLKHLKKFDPKFSASRLLFTEHHLAHAASAFYPSPFEEALILTMDGVGEWTTTSAAIGSHNEIKIFKEIHFPHSLGLLYSAFTYYTGFKVNSGEYKLMGLAPYGNPKYETHILENLIDLKEDGSFRLNMDYFDFCTELRMTNDQKFEALFGEPRRTPETPLRQFDMDLAASIQKVLETAVIRLATNLQKETGQQNLCLAGGVALNCVANGKLLKENIFKNIYIQPAAGDAGGALGAAFYGYYQIKNNKRHAHIDKMEGSYLGPQFDTENIISSLTSLGAHFEVLTDHELYETVTEDLIKENVIGWFQGKTEFGPRALGNRSIIADARSSKMQEKLNLKIKFRESFRPFAPAILAEDVSSYFDLHSSSPYMLIVSDVLKKHQTKLPENYESLFGIEKLNIPRSSIPAITHVDFSARIQTVHKHTNLRFYELLSKFKEKTGCSILVNTSFNIRGEPIVLTPNDAFRCFMGTDMDILVIGNCYLQKEKQNPLLKEDYKSQFHLD
ncbi:MAG: carbamoyltransferase [Proteobacteria bacterium]|nr:carbamoyltransferase [Pseudomonadota bacterium]